MLKLFTAFVFTAIYCVIFSQDDRKVNYAKMDTIQIYDVNLSYYADISGREEFFVNDVQVDKQRYEKYDSFKKTQNCCPCVVEHLTIHDTLISRATECRTCRVGDYTEYYPNGNFKCLGKYKQNDTENWQSLRNRGLCDIKTSEWVYFDVHGDTLYIEKWNNGEFISQYPDQHSDDIWGVHFELNGHLIQEDSISVDEFNELTLVPKYKSDKPHSGINIRFDLSIHSSPKEGIVITKIPFQDLTNIDLIESIKSTDWENKTIDYVAIEVFYNNESIQYKKINIK